MEEWRAIGEALGVGLISAVCKFGILWLVVGLVIKLAANAFGLGVDDTDASGWKRSGLRLYVDHKTGVQYVSNGRSLVVRVDAPPAPP